MRGGGPNQFRQRKIYGIDGVIFFLTETGDLHQSQFDEQPLVGRLPDFAVEVREQRYGAEKKFGRAGGRLRPVSFHQRTGKFQQPERRLVAGHQQVAQALENIKHILDTAGSGIENVVRATIYMKNVEDFHEVDDVYAQTFIGSVKPARVAFGGNDIPKGALVEIDAIAAL